MKKKAPTDEELRNALDDEGLDWCFRRPLAQIVAERNKLIEPK